MTVCFCHTLIGLIIWGTNKTMFFDNSYSIIVLWYELHIFKYVEMFRLVYTKYFFKILLCKSTCKVLASCLLCFDANVMVALICLRFFKLSRTCELEYLARLKVLHNQPFLTSMRSFPLLPWKMSQKTDRQYFPSIRIFSFRMGSTVEEIRYTSLCIPNFQKRNPIVVLPVFNM